jgi:malonyl-CoA O-methyltransferase
MNIDEAYNLWSASYDDVANKTRDLDRQVTQAALAGQRYATIIEAGCGTGKNTGLLAEIADRVQALDFSPGMLERARARIQAPNVSFHHADLSRPWPCADAAAELVLFNLVLEHIEDLDFAFGEARRCVQPGGQVFVCELHPFKQYVGKKATIEQGESNIEIQAFVHHMSDYVQAAGRQGLQLMQFGEHWPSAEERTGPPLLLSLRLRRS